MKTVISTTIRRVEITQIFSADEKGGEAIYLNPMARYSPHLSLAENVKLSNKDRYGHVYTYSTLWTLAEMEHQQKGLVLEQ